MENTAIEKSSVNLSTELSTNSSTMWCSIQGGDKQTKAKLFNASNNPEHKVGDYINKVIKVTDALVEIIELENEETGIVETAPRVVLIDEKGEAYQAVSAGIFNALKKAIQIFGEPTWDEPLPVLVKQVSVKNGSMLTFDVKF